MKNELKVLFYLKKNQSKKTGLCPVMGRIQVDKSMAQFSLKIDADANLWDTRAGRMLGKSKLSLEVNQVINKINLLIHTRYNELRALHSTVNASDLKNMSQGIACSQASVLELFRDIKQNISERVGIDYSVAALGQYILSYNALEGYIQKKLQVSDLSFKALNFSHIEGYYHHLRIERKLSVGTSNIYLIYFRKVVNKAVSQGIIYSDPFFGFETEQAKVEHKTLTKEELELFMTDEPRVRQQKKTRDVFLFSVFTGLSYIDMKNLTYDDIKTLEDGSQWIVAKRQKTKVEYRVRLLDISLAIIEKYRGKMEDNKVLDVPQIMTIYDGLNAIAKRCGIAKKLSIHIARHRKNNYCLVIN